MTDMIVFICGLALGVVYEKQIRKYKEAAIRAASAAKNELKKG